MNHIFVKATFLVQWKVHLLCNLHTNGEFSVSRGNAMPPVSMYWNNVFSAFTVPDVTKVTRVIETKPSVTKVTRVIEAKPSVTKVTRVIEAKPSITKVTRVIDNDPTITKVTRVVSGKNLRSSLFNLR